MKLSEIKELDNESLISEFYWIAVRTTNEANSKRGLTQKSKKVEDWIIAEVIKRFNLDEKKLLDELDY